MKIKSPDLPDDGVVSSRSDEIERVLILQHEGLGFKV